jgi:hypothetical protein
MIIYLFIYLFKTDKKMKHFAKTVITDTTFRNQPPNSDQNSDPGMWRSAANFTPPCLTFRYNCDCGRWRYVITVIAHEVLHLQIRLKLWARLILTPQARINLQQSATSAITVIP